MRRNPSEGESGPLTLGQAAKVGVRIMVWCKACQHRDDPDMAVQVAHCGEGMTVIDWARLLRCSACGVRDADFVVTGGRR
jgi:hypothetical protein